MRQFFLKQLAKIVYIHIDSVYTFLLSLFSIWYMGKKHVLMAQNHFHLPFSKQYLSSNETTNMHITYLCLITFYSHLDWMSVRHYNHFINCIFIDYLQYKIDILCSHCIDDLLMRSFCYPYKIIISQCDLLFWAAIKRSTLLSVSLTDCLQSCCTRWRHIMWLSAHRLSVCFMCVPAAH